MSSWSCSYVQLECIHNSKMAIFCFKFIIIAILLLSQGLSRRCQLHCSAGTKWSWWLHMGLAKVEPDLLNSSWDHKESDMTKQLTYSYWKSLHVLFSQFPIWLSPSSLSSFDSSVIWSRSTLLITILVQSKVVQIKFILGTWVDQANVFWNNICLFFDS